MLDFDTWDPYCPVVLPLGTVTVAPIVAASMGVLIPFILFAVALFMHMWNMWDFNLQTSLSNIGTQQFGSQMEHTTFLHRDNFATRGFRDRRTFS
jgi:hypothetical protein